MKIESKTNCPLNKFNPCKEINCSWFIRLRGINPNTGQDIDEWGCAVTWLPILLIENSQQQRGTSSAVESFRNEMVKANENTEKLLLGGCAQKPTIEA